MTCTDSNSNTVLISNVFTALHLQKKICMVVTDSFNNEWMGINQGIAKQYDDMKDKINVSIV